MSSSSRETLEEIKEHLFEGISLKQEKYSAAGEKKSKHQTDDLLNLLDAVARCLNFLMSETCAAVFLDSEKKKIFLAVNGNGTGNHFWESWTEIRNISDEKKDTYYQKYLVNYHNNSFDCDLIKTSIFGYVSVEKTVELQMLLKKARSDITLKSSIKEFGLAPNFVEELMEFDKKFSLFLENFNNPDPDYSSILNNYKQSIAAAEGLILCFKVWKINMKKKYKEKNGIGVIGKKFIHYLREYFSAEITEKIIAMKPLLYAFRRMQKDFQLLQESSKMLMQYTMEAPCTNEKMHAEMKILTLLIQEGYLNVTSNNRVGVSKSLCAPCKGMLETIQKTHPGRVTTKGHHGKVYPGWQFPPTESNAVYLRFLLVMAEEHQKLWLLDHLRAKDAVSDNTSDDAYSETEGPLETSSNAERNNMDLLELSAEVLSDLWKIQKSFYERGFYIQLVNPFVPVLVGEEELYPYQIVDKVKDKEVKKSLSEYLEGASQLFS